MLNPFSFTSPDSLSDKTLVESVVTYRKFLSQLGRFSSSRQVDRIRRQVRMALAELSKEASRRMFDTTRLLIR